VRLLWWRRKQRAEPIGEAEAYKRSYGRASDVTVLERGEALRRAFLVRLERRRGGS
jgi:hypothetical protein